MSCWTSCPPLICLPDFSLGFPLIRLLGHPRLVSLVGSLCPQSCCGQKGFSSEDNCSICEGSMEKPQPSHLEGELGSGTSGPQSDPTAILGGVYTRTAPCCIDPSWKDEAIHAIIWMICVIHLSLSLQKLNVGASGSPLSQPGIQESNAETTTLGTAGTGTCLRNSSLQLQGAEQVFIIKF